MALTYADFNKRPAIEDYLYRKESKASGDIIEWITPGDMKGKISFEESVNEGEDLTIGSCITGKINFKLDNADGLALAVAGKEYIWKKLVQKSSIKMGMPEVGIELKAVCMYRGYFYASDAHKNAIYGIDPDYNIIYQTIDTDAPEAVVDAFCIIGNELMAFSKGQDYINIYSLNIPGELGGRQQRSLNSYQQRQVNSLCETKTSIFDTDTGLNKFQPSGKNLVMTTWEWLDMGYFTAEKPVKLKASVIDVTAYDRLARFDVVVDDWLKDIDFTKETPASLLRSLCDYLRTPTNGLAGVRPNASLVIQSEITGESVTGKDILKYIAQYTAGFVKVRPTGYLIIAEFQSINHSINNSVYNTLETAEYVTDVIDKMQVKNAENDIGVIVGTGTNALVIENNPLFPGDSGLAEFLLEKVFASINNISYRPFELKAIQNPLIRAGDVFEIVDRDGNIIKAYVMHRTMKGGIDTYEATGNQRRSSQVDPVNRYIQNVNGRIHELVVTIDEFSSTIKDMEGNYSSITQTIDQISFDVYDANGDVSARISAEVKDGISSISLTADDIKIQGTTTLSSLFTSGTTTIDGSKITTGTVSASFLTLGDEDSAFIYTAGGDLVLHPSSEEDGEIDIGTPGGGDTNVLSTYLRCNRLTATHNIVTSRQIAAYSGIFEGWCYAPDWTEGSDARIKHDIHTLDSFSMKNFLMSLNPVRYRMNDDPDDKLRYGFVAQEVQKALAEHGLDEGDSPIYRIHDGRYGVSYNDLIAPIVSVLQDLNNRVIELEKGVSV